MWKLCALLLLSALTTLQLSAAKPVSEQGKELRDASKEEDAAKRIRELLLDILEERIVEEGPKEAPSSGQEKRVGPWDLAPMDSDDEGANSERFGPWTLNVNSDTNGHKKPVEEDRSVEKARVIGLGARALSDDTPLSELTVGDLKTLVQHSVKRVISEMQ